MSLGIKHLQDRHTRALAALDKLAWCVEQWPIVDRRVRTLQEGRRGASRAEAAMIDDRCREILVEQNRQLAEAAARVAAACGSFQRKLEEAAGEVTADTLREMMLNELAYKSHCITRMRVAMSHGEQTYHNEIGRVQREQFERAARAVA